jgi:hypothetical protein
VVEGGFGKEWATRLVGLSRLSPLSPSLARLIVGSRFVGCRCRHLLGGAISRAAARRSTSRAGFWKSAVDLLLARVDLVAVDLSVYVPANTGTQFELQRVIDRLPINRAVLLCDAGSDRAFIEAQVRYHWSQMASGSPNVGTAERTILIAVTGAETANSWCGCWNGADRCRSEIQP